MEDVARPVVEVDARHAVRVAERAGAVRIGGQAGAGPLPDAMSNGGIDDELELGREAAAAAGLVPHHL
ncbi:hypothetical protein D3C83_63420 [compost metagenome]